LIVILTIFSSESLLKVWEVSEDLVLMAVVGPRIQVSPSKLAFKQMENIS
jgi:hypothetical protein